MRNHKIGSERGEPRLRSRTAGPVVLLAALLSACDAGPAASPSQSTIPSSQETAAVTTPAPTPATSLSGVTASEIDSTLELRVVIAGDVGGPGRTPALSLYRDGTILRRTDAGPRLTKVTREALALLKDTALASGLFAESGSIAIDPEYAGGFMSYVVELRTDNGVVRRSTPNAVAGKDAAASAALIALAERLSAPELLVPGDGWVLPQQQAVPYVASDYLLEIVTQPYGGDPDAPDAPQDVADVVWPLDGKLVAWGVPYESGPSADGERRCGTLGLADAARVDAALEGRWSSERLPASDWMLASLLWRDSMASVEVMVSSLLPDDLVACPPDPNAPEPSPLDELLPASSS